MIRRQKSISAGLSVMRSNTNFKTGTGWNRSRIIALSIGVELMPGFFIAGIFMADCRKKKGGTIN